MHAYREQGDKRARDRLVQLYLPLVGAFAHRYQRLGVEHDDLVQAGSVGLLNAIERYELGRGGDEFMAFAVPTIVGEIKRQLRDRADTVRLPRPLQEAAARLPRVRAELSARLRRTPSEAELATELGIPPAELGRLEAAGRPLDLADEQAAGLAANNGDSEADLSDERVQLAGAFRALDAAEHRIIYLRFVKDLSRKRTANELGMSEAQLSRRTQAALAKLRVELERRGSGQQATEGPAPEREPPDTPPEPPRKTARDSHSGRLLLRMPQSLHDELARAAKREDVSLNQFITNTLAAAMGWQQTEASESDRESEPQRPAPRWLPVALVTNIVAVVVAGVVALVLLLAALQQGW